MNFSFISKSASGKIFYLLVLGFYAHDLCKNAKNRIVMSFLSQTLCKTAVVLNGPLFIFLLAMPTWVLHRAKVWSIPSPYLGNVEEQKSWRWPFFFFQNSFIFHFCFGLKVPTDFPEFSKILCSFVTKRTIICFKKSWCMKK